MVGEWRLSVLTRAQIDFRLKILIHNPLQADICSCQYHYIFFCFKSLARAFPVKDWIKPLVLLYKDIYLISQSMYPTLKLSSFRFGGQMGGLQYNVPNVVLLLFRNLSIPRGICPIVQDTYFDLLCFLGRSVRDDLCILLVLPFFFLGGRTVGLT